MANQTIYDPRSFATVLRRLETSDQGHASVFNTLFEALINNDLYLKDYTDAQITALIAAAPGALDTLNELAAALGDDASFSTTILTALAAKVAQADFDAHKAEEAQQQYLRVRGVRYNG